MMKYKMVNDVILILIVLIMASYCHAENSKQRLDDVRKLLKSINKQALKSIKSPDGDIIDCVDINKQPAFDDPSLKNHTIQMNPNNYPEEVPYFPKSGENEGGEVTQLWHNSGECPDGTIPIRRTKEEDVLRASSFKSYGRKKLTSFPNLSDDEHEYAAASSETGKYFGAKATINVWKPEVTANTTEFSLSQIWVTAGTYDSGLNSIEVGWMVHPNLYGDHNTRLFTYWTSDGYEKTGCYNLLCSGFVQTNKKIALGANINPISSYQGNQYVVTTLIWKDTIRGNWWLRIETDILGYWPASLFTHLKESASEIQWGGEIINTLSNGQHTITQMGSGHFPDEGYKKASFIRNIEVVDGSNKLYVVDKLNPSNEENCYDIQPGKNKEWGTYFFYGGPGRNGLCQI